MRNPSVRTWGPQIILYVHRPRKWGVDARNDAIWIIPYIRTFGNFDDAAADDNDEDENDDDYGDDDDDYDDDADDDDADDDDDDNDNLNLNLNLNLT